MSTANVRPYEVNETAVGAAPEKTYLVEATSQAAALGKVSKARFKVSTPNASRVAELMRSGVTYVPLEEEGAPKAAAASKA